MRKLIFILLFSISSFMAYCQDVVGSRVIATQSFFLRNRWVDSIRVDTVGLSTDNRSLMTAAAIYKFVLNRSSSGGSGTLTNFSIVTANGFSGSVATSTTTPALTITTTITGILKGNGTAISAAVAGTDYLTPTGSAALLTSFPTLNQNTTGTAGGLSANIAESQVTNLVSDLALKSPLASPIFTGLVTTPLIKITSGVPGAGKVLTSDADGDATWETAASSGANALGTYIVQTATNAPTNAQILASLATGIIKNTTTTGVLSIAVAGDFPTLNQNTTGSAASLTTGRTISISGDITYTSPSFDGSANVTAAGTLATVNSNVGSFGSATQAGTFTVNAKGLITAASNTTITPAVGSITGLGTNVATALGVAVGSAGAFVTFNGALGTPSSGTLTNATGLPIIAGTTGTLTIARGGTNLTALGTALQEIRVNAGATALEYFTPAAAGNTIYTGDGTLSGDRAIDLNGSVLSITQGGEEFFQADPTLNNEFVKLSAINSTGDNNGALFSGATTAIDAQFRVKANFNDVVNEVLIEGFADATTAILSYTADIHTFTGAMRLVALAGNGTGTVGVDNDGDLSFIPDFVLSATYFDGAGTVGDPVVPIIDVTITDGSVVPPTSNSVFDAMALKANLASPTFTGTITTPLIKITSGVPGSGKVLTSDADGDATWETPAGGTLNLSYDATNHEVDIDGGGTSAIIPLALADGATEGLASFTAADFDLTSGNVAIDYANGQAATASVNGFMTNTTQTFAGSKTFATVTLTSLFTNSTAINGNLFVPAATSASTATGATMLFEGATTVGYRTGFRGSTSYTLVAGYGYSNLIVGETALTEASSGTHPLLAGVVLKPPVVSNAAGATAELATLYIEGPPTGVTPTGRASSLWVIGEARFGKAGSSQGTLVIQGSTSGSAIITTAAAAGTPTITLPATTGTLALLDSPTFTGTPAAPTAAAGTNTTQLATTAFHFANLKDNHMTAFQAMSSAIKAEPIGRTFSQLDNATSATALVDGDIRFISTFLPTDATLTGIKFWLVVACVASGNTMSKVGLYTSDGTTLTKVAESANNANLFKGTLDIMHSEVFSSTYAATRGVYYIAYLHNPTGESTVPTISRFPSLSSAAMSGMDFTTGDMYSGTIGGQTDLPATQALSGLTKSNVISYMAAY